MRKGLQAFRAQSIREAAQKHVVHLQGEVLPLSTYTIPGQAGWEVLAAALQWNPSLRPSAAALAQKPWKEETVADDRSPAQSSPHGGQRRSRLHRWHQHSQWRLGLPLVHTQGKRHGSSAPNHLRRNWKLMASASVLGIATPLVTGTGMVATASSWWRDLRTVRLACVPSRHARRPSITGRCAGSTIKFLAVAIGTAFDTGGAAMAAFIDSMRRDRLLTQVLQTSPQRSHCWS